MKRYAEYKDSGVEWIGEIPSGWGMKKIKFVFQEKKSKKNPELNSGSISFGVVVYKDDEKILESTKESYQELLKGEFLINPLNLNYDLKSLRIGMSRINVVVSQGYIILILKDGFNPFYFEYLLRRFDVIHMKSLGQGVRQTISFNHIKDEYLVIPPLHEQREIVDYLDRKTSEIDRLITITRKKIQLLKERRTSIINQVVTKGLNPDVEMKDSGVEWIGEIPSGWGFAPIKYITQRNKDSIRTGPFGSSLKSNDFIDEGIRVYNQRSVYDEDFSKSNLFVSNEKYQELKSFEVVPKDVLITSRGTIGRMTIVPENGEVGVLHPCLIRLRLNRDLISDRFLWFYMNQSSIFLTSVLFESNSTTIEVIYSETISNVRFPLPPLNEQREIVDYLDRKTSEIDGMVTIEEERIELLREYRQSLINEVVTGKRCVLQSSNQIPVT